MDGNDALKGTSALWVPDSFDAMIMRAKTMLSNGYEWTEQNINLFIRGRSVAIVFLISLICSAD